MRIAILLVAGLVTMVLALSRGPDEQSHETILNALRAVDLTFAGMQRDVLQARSGILKNYDFLGLAIDRMRVDLQRIAAISASVSVEDRASLEERLAAVGQSIAHNEAMIEQFKSGNAMIQNSLRIFLQTLNEIRKRMVGAESVPALLETQLLGQQMWRFQNAHDPALAAELRSGLLRLRKATWPEMADLKTSLVEHGLLIVRTLPAVDAVVGATQAAETVAGIRELQHEYFRQFGRMNARMSTIRLMLSLISLGLCAYATMLAFRLKFFADSVSWRLHVEQSVNDAVTRLSLEPERFKAVMYDALVRMEQVFGFESVCLLSLDPADWSQKDTFGRQEPLENCSLLARDFLQDLRARLPTQRDLVLWRYAIPARGVARLISALRKPKPLAVASFVRPHDDLAVLMVARCQPAFWNMRTDAQILRMTTELLALALEKHHRLADLDELDRRMEETQRLEAVGTLAGGVAHEFNNILMAIMGYAEMAAAALTPGLPTRGYVDNVLGAGRRAKLVIDQMLAFGRMRRNPLRPFDAARAASEMLPMIEVCLPAGVKLHVDLPEEVAVVSGSAIEIQQVLVNLCKNAGEAIAGRALFGHAEPESGRRQTEPSEICGNVKLSLDAVEPSREHILTHGALAPGPHWRFAVTDSGPGIAPAQLQRIFEPFFTTKGDRGTGLGLSVVHGTVQSLKGAMNVSSIPGKGTRFELYFPRLDAGALFLSNADDTTAVHSDMTNPAARGGTVGPRGDSALGNGELVAVIDGRENARLMWEEKIAALGYEPVGFESAAQLSQWVESATRVATVPDALAIALGGEDDANCPALAGLLRSYPDLPVVYLLDGAVVPTVSVRSHRFLKKPVSARALRDALAGVLEKARRQGIGLADRTEADAISTSPYQAPPAALK